jgi:hypothetical protein
MSSDKKVGLRGVYSRNYRTFTDYECMKGICRRKVMVSLPSVEKNIDGCELLTRCKKM